MGRLIDEAGNRYGKLLVARREGTDGRGRKSGCATWLCICDCGTQRVVMGQHLRIENLELWSSRHPGGQRVADKVEWAKEILSTYEPGALVWYEPDWTPDPGFMRGSIGMAA